MHLFDPNTTQETHLSDEHHNERRISAILRRAAHDVKTDEQ
jgi:hypothetical protein